MRPPHIPDLKKVVGPVIANLRAQAASQVKNFADREATMFKDRIQAQDFVSIKEIPLNDRYRKKKLAHGLSGKTFIARGDYVKGIRVHARMTQTGMNIYIGHHPSLRVRDIWTGRLRNEWPMQLVAQVLEEGSANGHVPPRKHWEPFFWQMQPRSSAVRTELRRYLVRQLRAHNRGR